jgi:acyl-CoA thioesterase
VRLPDELELSAATLAVVGDFVPFGIGQALGQRAGGNSLDNTMRIVHPLPTAPRAPIARTPATTGRATTGTTATTTATAPAVAADWVLADIRVDAVGDGFGHGLVHLWAEDGTLLGTASQSTIVRSWGDETDMKG